MREHQHLKPSIKKFEQLCAHLQMLHAIFLRTHTVNIQSVFEIMFKLIELCQPLFTSPTPKATGKQSPIYKQEMIKRNALLLKAYNQLDYLKKPWVRYRKIATDIKRFSGLLKSGKHMFPEDQYETIIYQLCTGFTFKPIDTPNGIHSAIGELIESESFSND